MFTHNVAIKDIYIHTVHCTLRCSMKPNEYRKGNVTLASISLRGLFLETEPRRVLLSLLMRGVLFVAGKPINSTHSRFRCLLFLGGLIFLPPSGGGDAKLIDWGRLHGLGSLRCKSRSENRKTKCNSCKSRPTRPPSIHQSGDNNVVVTQLGIIPFAVKKHPWIWGWATATAEAAETFFLLDLFPFFKKWNFLIVLPLLLNESKMEKFSLPRILEQRFVDFFSVWRAYFLIFIRRHQLVFAWPLALYSYTCRRYGWSRMFHENKDAVSFIFQPYGTRQFE